MSQSILSRPKVSASHSRHGFDNSCFRNFNQSLGMLIPVYCKAFPAGTKGSFNRFTFTRTAKVLYPAFQGVHECFDVFKVPLRLLFSKWNDFKLNVNDINSSRLLNLSSIGNPDLNLEAMCPRFDFGNRSFEKIADNGDNAGLRPNEMNEALRLLDHLRYGSKSIFQDSACVMNVFKLAAYQKIYFDHYRNTSYEANDPFAYNLDWTLDSGTQTGLIDLTVEGDQGNMARHTINQLLNLRFVNLRNDAFHNIYPSLSYVLTTPNGTQWSLPSSVVGALKDGTKPTIDVRPWSNLGNLSAAILTSSSSGSSAISVQTIRGMFALDKLMRASAYAPKHIKDQFKARFGVDLPDSVQNHSDRLGSFRNEVIFGEVTSTANTASEGSNLGDVGGKGVGSGDWEKKPINFYCEEDSIIMCLHYYTMDAIYDSDSIDEWNTKLAREDFFQPEFENLGLRPFYQKFVTQNQSPNAILGYTVPNQCYKIEPDLNTGIFQEHFYNFNRQGIPFTNTSPLKAFVSHINHEYPTTGGVPYTYFKVYPYYLNGIFQQDFDDYDFNTDQFYGHMKFRVPVVMPMSVHGQPSL